MRNVLLGALAVIGVGLSAGAARAQPGVVWVPIYTGAPVAEPVQYYYGWQHEEWRRQEWRRHEEEERRRAAWHRWHEHEEHERDGWRAGWRDGRHEEWREHRGW